MSRPPHQYTGKGSGGVDDTDGVGSGMSAMGFTTTPSSAKIFQGSSSTIKSGGMRHTRADMGSSSRPLSGATLSSYPQRHQQRVTADQPQVDNKALSLARKFIGRMQTAKPGNNNNHRNHHGTAAAASSSSPTNHGPLMPQSPSGGGGVGTSTTSLFGVGDEVGGVETRSTFLMSTIADHGGKHFTSEEYATNRLRIGASYEDKAFDNIIRSKTHHIVGFSFLGLVAMVGFSMYTWFAYTPENPDNPIDAYTDDEDVSVSILNIMYLGQAIITVTTVTTCILIGQKYNLLLMQKRAEWSGVTVQELERHRGDVVVDATKKRYFKSSYSFWHSSLKYRLFLELFVHILHPFVFMAKRENISTVVDVESTPNPIYKLLQLCMFFRLYLVADLLHLNSTYFRNRFEIITAKPELLKVGFNIRRSLSLRIIFYNRPVRSLIIVAGLAMIIFGFMLFITERIEGVPIVTIPDRFNPTDALWSAFESFTTLGYGDISIQTTLGRMVAIICSILGRLSFIVFGAVLVSKMALTKEQKFGVEFLASRQADKAYRGAAEGLIWTWIQVHLLPNVAKRVALRNLSSGAVMIGGDEEEDMDDYDQQQHEYGGISRQQYSKGHKGNRIYYATKKFRTARRRLEASFTHAEDEVINLKITAVQELVDAVAVEVDEHEKRVLEVETDLQKRLKDMTFKVARLREKGHVPV